MNLIQAKMYFNLFQPVLPVDENLVESKVAGGPETEPRFIGSCMQSNISHFLKQVCRAVVKNIVNSTLVAFKRVIYSLLIE